MKIDINRDLTNLDVQANKKVANLLLTNLKKGNQILQNELSGSDTSDMSVSSAINQNQPKEYINVQNRNSVPNSTIKSTPNISSNSTPSANIKEFIRSSQLFENEVNEFVSDLNLNSVDEVYNVKGGALTNDKLDSINVEYLNNLDINALKREKIKYVKDKNQTSQQLTLKERRMYDLQEEQDSEEHAENEEKLNQLKSEIEEILKEMDDMTALLNLFEQKMHLVDETIADLVTINDLYDDTLDSFDLSYNFALLPKKRSINELTNVIEPMQKANNATKNVDLIFQYYPNYASLNNTDKRIVEKLFFGKWFTVDQLSEAMIKNGFSLTTTLIRPKKKDDNHQITKSVQSLQSLFNDYKNNQKGVGRKNTVFVEDPKNKNNPVDYPTDSVRRLSNHVTNLIVQCTALVNSKFKGSSFADNQTLDKLYEELADKISVITSYNKKNVQLVKLDSDFQKLYKLVHQGINSFVLPTSTAGGSIQIPKHLYTEQKTYITNYPKYL